MRRLEDSSKSIKIRITWISLSQFFFYIGVFLKQFYILPSGSLQIGDVCLGFSFVFSIGKISKRRYGDNADDQYLLFFLIFVFIINFLYSVVYSSTSFLISFFYYLFNFMVVLSFRENSRDKEFLKCLQVSLKAAVSLQLLIYLGGLGRWYAGRYMGTFNDPNQFGFYIFSATLIIYSISIILNQKQPYFWLAIMFFLVLQSASTGMALGVVSFFITWLFFLLLQKRKNMAVLFLCVAVLLILMIILLLNFSIKLPSFISDSFMYRRILEKINKISRDDAVINGVSSDRGWFLLKDYWYKILYGAGEGKGGRLKGWGGEVHSSIFAPLFYYGIFPFYLWMKWCYKQLKNIDKSMICVYVALFCESITLVNNRQPFFWILLTIGSIKILDKEDSF